jgi:hypothetical protein
MALGVTNESPSDSGLCWQKPPAGQESNNDLLRLPKFSSILPES